jgi:nitronate monooxygenase
MARVKPAHDEENRSSSLPLPESFRGRLALPAIAAPMFLVSGPDLVVETCRAGVIGTFPSLNQRSTDAYAAWLDEIDERLANHPDAAPFGINLIVNKSTARVGADLETTVKHKVPLVITSLGANKEVVDAVHSYGGVVFHDVINMRHARKAAEAGVDGLIAVCSGAGGHAGTMSPFALVSEIRAFFDKTVILSGVISTGNQIAAAELMGADLAYLGTRFIATRESLADQRFKEMIVASRASDIVYTPAISGVHGNFLKPSLIAAGLDPDNLPEKPQGYLTGEKRAWKDVWSAGHGVGAIADIPSVAELCARLKREYAEACAGLAERAQPLLRARESLYPAP